MLFTVYKKTKERMMTSFCGLTLKNLFLFNQAKEIGFDYILNPDTGELHAVSSSFFSSHNLRFADLSNFIGLTNVGWVNIDLFPEGTEIPVFDLLSGQQLGIYKLNKCLHCFK